MLVCDDIPAAVKCASASRWPEKEDARPKNQTRANRTVRFAKIFCHLPPRLTWIYRDDSRRGPGRCCQRRCYPQWRMRCTSNTRARYLLCKACASSLRLTTASKDITQCPLSCDFSDCVTTFCDVLACECSSPEEEARGPKENSLLRFKMDGCPKTGH